MPGTAAEASTLGQPVVPANGLESAPDVASEARGVGATAFVVTLLGVGVSTYMTIAYFTEASILACSGGGELSCTMVTTSPQSRTLGIPVAVLGLGYFIVMSVLTSPAVWRRNTQWVAKVRTTLLVGGLVFVLWLIAAEILIIGHVCLWCTGVHVILIALVLVMTRATPRQLGIDANELAGATR